LKLVVAVIILGIETVFSSSEAIACTKRHWCLL